MTMRTPGDDFELAAGFLVTEGIIDARVRSRTRRLRSRPQAWPAALQYRRREAARRKELSIVERLRRHFFAASSCGICGKASIDAVRIRESGRRKAICGSIRNC